MMASILVIDDEPGIRSTVKDILEDEGYRVHTAEDGPAGLDILKREKIDAVILDVWLPRMGGIDVLKAVKDAWPSVEVIVVSGHASIEMAVSAVKLGAFDFIEKPLSIDRLATAVRNALAIAGLREENRRLKRGMPETETLIVRSKTMRQVVELIEQSAQSDARVLITGDNGTGKELVARRIHELSARANGPFIAVNCAALPDNLIESELFGHEKGAFTDAVARRKGKFELASGGTLFLDEIGDMSLSAQAKVLRVIQDMRFERVGGEESIQVDVRLIAATNRDLKARIASGLFREDLFFRLNVIPIRMPSLAERPQDIGPMAEYFLGSLSGLKTRRLSEEAVAVLAAQDWPGNARELKNFMERMAVMSDEDELSAETVRHFLGKTPCETPQPPEGDCFQSLAALPLADAKNEFERRYILHHLRKTGYNVSRTAEAIGAYPSNVHAKIKKFGIEAGE